MKNIVFAIAACVTMIAGATQYSKLAIITAAKQRGIWPQMSAFIEQSGFRDEWLACQYLSDDYPQYAAITNGLAAAGVPSETIRAIISSAEDTSVPDAVFRRMYDREMKTPQGRLKWHGAVVTNIVDTANLKRVQVFEDGYTWTDNFKSVEAMGIEEQISAAEREARRKAAAEQAAKLKAERKAARIAELETNMDELAAKLAKQRDYPFELAKMLLQNELSKLQSTNTVNAVITPQ